MNSLGGDDGEGGGKVIRFTLPSLPTSCNRLYDINHVQRRVRLSDSGRKWKSDMQYLIPRFEIAPTSLLRIEYVAHYPWHHRNGKRRRVDASNLMKLLHDTICMRIGIDDSRVSEGSFASVDAPEEKLEITLREIITEGASC
jgi:Holliday junction resolvase RusA-like endonuclease